MRKPNTQNNAADNGPDVSLPTCFVSYSWDSDDHKAWVCKLATSLRSHGVDVQFDQWNLRLGMDVTQYMEEHIRSSDYVLLVCTPAFALRANTGKGGVGYEKGIITGEIYHGAQATKFIPVLRAGEPKECLPSYLRNRLYVDFRREANFDAGVQAIVRHVYQKPESDLPPLASAKVYGITGRACHPNATQDLISFASLMDYARRNYRDLDVTPNHIKEIVANLGQLGYRTIAELDMSIRPVRHIARQVQCLACREYACDQITLALALSNPEYGDLLGPHQAEHADWLRKQRPRLRTNRDGWL